METKGPCRDAGGALWYFGSRADEM